MNSNHFSLWLSIGPVFSMHLSIDLFTWTAFALLFTNYSLTVLFSFWKVLTRCWFWSDNQWPDHLCLTRSKSKAFQNGPINLTGHWHLWWHVFSPRHLCAQTHHLWLLVKVIGKAAIMLEVNKNPLMLYCCSVLFLRLLDVCWLLHGPDRDVRTDCPDDSAIRHSVNDIWDSKEENCKGEQRLPLRY